MTSRHSSRKWGLEKTFGPYYLDWKRRARVRPRAALDPHHNRPGPWAGALRLPHRHCDGAALLGRRCARGPAVNERRRDARRGRPAQYGYCLSVSAPAGWAAPRTPGPAHDSRSLLGTCSTTVNPGGQSRRPGWRPRVGPRCPRAELQARMFAAPDGVASREVAVVEATHADTASTTRCRSRPRQRPRRITEGPRSRAEARTATGTPRARPRINEPREARLRTLPGGPSRPASRLIALGPRAGAVTGPVDVGPAQ